MTVQAQQLKAALDAVNWASNLSNFFSETKLVDRLSAANLRLAIWAKQFENIEKGNPALCFIREMQVAGNNTAALAGLALYKPAASCMRTVLESALYYSYFRTHHSELSTLASDPNFYISKADVLEYHKQHTRKFGALQTTFGLVGRINSWYSLVSAIVHGQIPGQWVEHVSLADIKYIKATANVVVDTFCTGEELVHVFFLCTVGREIWGNIASPAKKLLIKGLSGKARTALAIDSA